MILLPFDSHNHVHMGPVPPGRSLLPPDNNAGFAPASESETNVKPTAAVSGMAIMSTHPRDFHRVLGLATSLPKEVCSNVQIVPCLGVHPWFLHQVSEEEWQLVEDTQMPKWIQQMEELLQIHPDAIVGEIGLDGFHFDPRTEQLVSPMTKQVQAFRLQMELAARLGRPVSIHTVQCFGPLFETLTQIKKDGKKPKASKHGYNGEKKAAIASAAVAAGPGLPPKMYFHAFGGKIGTIDQILALCGKEPGQVYFGFAPVINFRSPKTAEVVRKVGIDRLLLETDHEDASLVPSSMEECIAFLADALTMKKEEVIERTTANAFEFYGLN